MGQVANMLADVVADVIQSHDGLWIVSGAAGVRIRLTVFLCFQILCQANTFSSPTCHITPSCPRCLIHTL